MKTIDFKFNSITGYTCKPRYELDEVFEVKGWVFQNKECMKELAPIGGCDTIHDKATSKSFSIVILISLILSYI